MKYDIVGLVQVFLALIGILVDVVLYIKDHSFQAWASGNITAKMTKRRVIKVVVLVLSVLLLFSGVLTVVLLDNSGTMYGKADIVVDVNGVEVEYEDAVSYNEYVQLDLPEKAGYELKGVKDACSGEYVFDENGKSFSPVEKRDLSDYKGKKLKAVYEPIKYSMSVRTATGAVAASFVYTVADNPTEMIEDPQPLDGYVFSGWFTDSKLKKPFTGNFADYTEEDGLMLYPKFELQSWKISWDTDGGEFISAPPQSYTMTTDFSLPDDRSVRRVGYDLVGWAENGILLDYFTATVRKDIRLKAVWQPKQYTITVYPNNGQEPTVQTVTYNDYYVLSEPTYKGYTFKGYSFGGNEMSLFGIYSYADNIKVVAQYEPNEYFVSYVVDGYTVDVAKATYGKVFAMRQAPTKSNHEFTGWYDKEVGGARISGGVYKNDGDMTVYANWIKTKVIELESDNEYTIDSSVDKAYVIGNYDKTDFLVKNVNIKVQQRDNNLILSLKNAGFKAGADTVAINCENSSYNLTVINEGKSQIEGGDGSKGADGASSKMNKDNCNGKKGNPGQHALNCGEVVFESSDKNSSLTLKSGRSGNGGNGGVDKKSGGRFWVNYTPDGGDSGDVLSALNCLKYSENGIKVSFESGELGDGGSKGSRKTMFTTKEGKDGGDGTVRDVISYK